MSGRLYLHVCECGFVVFVHLFCRVPVVVVVAAQPCYADYLTPDLVVGISTVCTLPESDANVGVEQRWGKYLLLLFAVPFAVGSPFDTVVVVLFLRPVVLPLPPVLLVPFAPRVCPMVEISFIAASVPFLVACIFFIDAPSFFPGAWEVVRLGLSP